MSRQQEIAERLEIVRANIAAVADHEVTLIAVTKTFPARDAQILHDLGVTDFGENRDVEGAENLRSCLALGIFKVRFKAIS